MPDRAPPSAAYDPATRLVPPRSSAPRGQNGREAFWLNFAKEKYMAPRPAAIRVSQRTVYDLLDDA